MSEQAWSEFDEFLCVNGDEDHSWRFLDDSDGVRVYECRACGAEMEEDDE